MTRSTEVTMRANRESGAGGGRSRRNRPRTKRSADHHHHPPTFPVDRLIVVPWPDPVLDVVGHDPRSLYVERYWLPIVGPSSLLLLRRLARSLDVTPDGFEIDPRHLAGELGLGARGGAHGPFWRAIDRACRFGAAQREHETLGLRRRLPPLTSRQVRRLPPSLAHDHAEWQQQQLQRPRRRTISHWSDHPTPPLPHPTGATEPPTPADPPAAPGGEGQ